MDFEKSRLERLKRSLYSRDVDSVPKEKRTPVSDREYDVKNDWGKTPSFELSPDNMTKPNNSFFNKFLVISVIFFVLALGVASFVFFGGFNTISSNNVDIKILGPATVSSGEELDASLSIVNNNHANLANVNLYIDYPDGTQSVVKTGTPLVRDKIVIGTLSQGQSNDQSIRAVLLGEKGKVMSIKLRLEYTTAGSNAVFSKDKSYDVTIGSAPILLNVTYPNEINSGQEVTLSIDATSNSTAVVQGVLLKISYPYGFTYESSNIKPLSSNNTIWNIGDLKGGDKKTLTVTGTLVGQNLEDRSFNISAGQSSNATPNDFETSLAVEQATVGIRKSFFDLTVSSANNNISQLGQNVPITINWHNTLPDRVVNNSVVTKISGNVFDPNAVNPGGGGFYRSADATVSWDKNTLSSLQSLNPGDDGYASFSVTSISNPVQTRSIKNPHIDINITMQGSRTGSDTSDISSLANATIKFISDLELSAKSYRGVGPLSNIGPIPPKANTESTYTVTWALTNTSNDLKNTTVTGVLPVNIVWKEETSPAGEHISFDPSSRTVTWNVGAVSAGVGFTYLARTVSFKIGVTPSVNQINMPIDLVTNISAVSTDTYTESKINASAQNVSTRYSDPGFVSGNENVVK